MIYRNIIIHIKVKCVKLYFAIENKYYRFYYFKLLIIIIFYAIYKLYVVYIYEYIHVLLLIIRYH